MVFHEITINLVKSLILMILGFDAKRGAQTTSFPKGILRFRTCRGFLEIPEFHNFPLKSRNFMNFNVFAENHVSAWQCSPELSISPRSHETVQNIRRDLMSCGVGAANFHESHSFS